jgi:hypothetical protein
MRWDQNAANLLTAFDHDIYYLGILAEELDPTSAEEGIETAVLTEEEHYYASASDAWARHARGDKSSIHEDIANPAKAQMSLNANFLYSIAIFEKYLADIVKHSARENADARKKYLQKYIEYAEQQMTKFGNKKGIANLADHEKCIEAYDELHEPLSLAKFMFGIKWESVEKVEDAYLDYKEARERRNLLLHRGRHFDTKYKDSVKTGFGKKYYQKTAQIFEGKEHLPSFDECEGESADVTNDYYSRILKCLCDLGECLHVHAFPLDQSEIERKGKDYLVHSDDIKIRGVLEDLLNRSDDLEEHAVLVHRITGIHQVLNRREYHSAGWGSPSEFIELQKQYGVLGVSHFLIFRVVVDEIREVLVKEGFRDQKKLHREKAMRSWIASEEERRSQLIEWINFIEQSELWKDWYIFVYVIAYHFGYIDGVKLEAFLNHYHTLKDVEPDWSIFYFAGVSFDLNAGLEDIFVLKEDLPKVSIVKDTGAVSVLAQATEEPVIVDDVQSVINYGSDKLWALAKWAKKTQNLESYQRSILGSVAIRVEKGQSPSTKQAVQVIIAIREADRLGFEDTEG